MRTRTQAPIGQREKALRTMSAYMAVPGLIGIMTGVCLSVLSNDVLDVRTMHDNGDDLPLIAFLLIFMAVIYVFMASVPRLMFLMLRIEPGAKDAVKAIWTDDDGKEIPSVPYIPAYKRQFPNRITPSAVAALAFCSVPVLAVPAVTSLVTGLLDQEYPPEPGTPEQLVFLLLFVAFLASITMAYYAMAWMMRRYHAKELTAMLYYEDNSKELEHIHKDLQKDKEEE